MRFSARRGRAPADQHESATQSERGK